jgi:hypothetical protein
MCSEIDGRLPPADVELINGCEIARRESIDVLPDAFSASKIAA